MSLPISIVITNYNRELFLGEAIASVLRQTWRDFELLVWDDGSTDNSVAIAQKYAGQDSRVRVIAAPHQGVTAARRDAIAQTTGTYIGWVDSDDYLAPTALEKTVTILNRQPEIGFVYTDYLDVDDKSKVIRYGRRSLIPYSQERLLVDFMTFQFRLIRRSIYDLVDGFNGSPNYAEDYDLCLRLSEVTQVAHIQQPLYYYRHHAGNITKQAQLELLLCSQQVIAQALQRRGLADKYQIDVELATGRFFLRHKQVEARRQEAGGRRQEVRENNSPRVLKRLLKPQPLCLGILPLVATLTAATVQAQQIIPANDGTNTIVTPNGNRLDITGGQTSSNGVNLFHSFQQFGLTPEQIANFQANPNLQNILGRVTGGNASIINGLIQVTGGTANLYLMNPAGFVFGPNASLNVPGAFTATTANGIAFGNSWFNASGGNNYSVLVGNPTGFAFTMSQPGAILNAGNLAVADGQSLSLLGGTVVNTGSLTAPAGQILVTSVPGENWVRLSQPGNLLSLEVQPSAANSNQPNNWTIPIPSLPELLTVGNTGVTANPDGTVKLSASNTTIPTTPGTTIVSGKVDASGATGGKVNILGQQVGLVDANINASGNNGGGTVLIGGDYKGQGTVPTATNTYVDSKSVIAADSNLNGDGGRVIVWGNDTTQFLGKITAGGGANSGNGGFVEVSGKNFLTFNGQVDTSAANGTLGTLLLDPSTLTIIDAATGGTFDGTPSNIPFGSADNGANTISWGALSGAGANIDLQATGNITINPITGNTTGVTTAAGVATLNLGGAGSFRLTSQNGAVTFANTSNIINTTGGDIFISGASLSLGNLNTTGNFAPSGNVNLSATGNITAGNIIATGNAYGASGNIAVTSSGGAITLGNLDTSIGDLAGGQAGTVNLSAVGNINTGNINSSATEGFRLGTGGNIQATSSAGSITTGAINSSVTKTGPSGDYTATSGAVNLTAAANITTGAIDSSATALNVDGDAIATGGNVTLRTTNAFGSTITFTTINSQATTEPGGTVTGGDVQVLTNGLVRGTGTLATGDTIATDGFFTGEGGASFAPPIGGNITIQHDGGPDNVQFIVGNASVNGTAGALNAGGTSIINAGSLSAPVLPNGGAASGTPAGITINSVNSPPTLTANTTLPTTQTNQSVAVNFGSLGAVVTDANNDNTTIRVDAVNSGTLTVNGAAVVPGVTTVSSGSNLVYTPPTDTTGLLNAFTIRASDGVSTSTPVQIGINVTQTNKPDIPVCNFNCLPTKVDEPVNNNGGEDKKVGEELPEDKFTGEFEQRLGVSGNTLKSPDDAKEIAIQIEKATGVKPAFIYLSFVPVEIAPTSSNKQLNTSAEKDNEQLEIVVITGKGNPIRKRIPEATKTKVLKAANQFRQEIINPSNNLYLRPSQQLYNWIIAPINAELQTQGITNLVFLPDIGLRSTPIAALHDGKRFLVEQYSVGLMPSLSLTNTLYTDIKKSQVLALGVSQSTQGQIPLPAVPVEISTLVTKLWQGKLLLDKQATLANLKAVRRQEPFGIIHMATHADFEGGALNKSYIQLWEDKLRLDQIRQLRLNDPQVEMMVLSACRTAVGNEEAEIGFAGLAVLAGVKTSVASLWYVSDLGTAALMTKFYESLKTAPIRAEALRQAQVAMATGKVFLKNGQIQGLEPVASLPLPAESIDEPDKSLSHPYYWAAFTMVGNPW
ncbi:CHAT domain-containing protein [Tolypothrix sp. PCC 7910]|uniref:CHAT domain-containing protein n=1 Tax=Tolypothrix sp. PCC 7910 TaxID=2099387 RepID=UPI00142789DE|nr:CHAT domain-containing protein [Tolypothrix sp. PCC 7910]QIR36754.1 CHAT domain-containing protein [Tolypothrix sp. PCC 7910]